METGPRRLLLCWIYILSVAGANGEQVESAAVYEKDYFREKMGRGPDTKETSRGLTVDAWLKADGRSLAKRATRSSHRPRCNALSRLVNLRFHRISILFSFSFFFLSSVKRRRRLRESYTTIVAILAHSDQRVIVLFCREKRGKCCAK